MSKLTLRYRYDSSFLEPGKQADDFGRLSIEVETEQFSGRGGFWVQWQDVREFGDALGTFPLAEDNPVTVQWGYDMQEGDDLVLRLEIAPANNRGDLAVRFEIADEDQPDCRVRGRLITNYSDIALFRTEIRSVMDRQA
jgi:hypothetical protein